MIGESN